MKGRPEQKEEAKELSLDYCLSLPVFLAIKGFLVTMPIAHLAAKRCC